jgi:hypothetical protein
MGVDPLTLGVIGAGASGLWGAANQTSANRANTRAQQQALAAQAHQQAIINSLAQSQMQGGPNPFAQMLMARLGGGQGGFTAPTGLTAPNISSDFVTGSQGFNAGQDALMQLIRGSGQPFDTSKQFAALAPLDQRLIDSQVAGLRGSTTSLGQRFGTATMGAERLLRGNFAQDIAARNAGIQSSAFESAQGRNLAAAQGLQQGGLSQAQLLAQIAQANAGNQLQTGQFNAAQNQAYNQFIASIIGQAGGLQQGQQSQNAQLLAIMAGLPQQGFAQQQPSALPGAFGDISQLLMFLPFLRGLQGGTTGATGNAGRA